MADLVTELLPVLSRSSEAPFNIFDVMHHGTHEKQLSNVFGWMLDTHGTHHLEETFLRIFVEKVNEGRSPGKRFPEAGYYVCQEVNTAGAGEQVQDMADLVLVHDEAVIVVENYYTSDGHGHSFERYFKHSKSGDQLLGAVVLLCQDHDPSRQTMGWEEAKVVTYAELLDRLWEAVQGDRVYQLRYPEPYSFIDQMHRKFVKGRSRVEDREVLDFVVAMCATGEAGRYAEQQHSSAAERFANDVSVQVRERFGEGREVLMRVKHRLTTYGKEHLIKQLNATLGHGFVGSVSARYVGNYRWTVNFDLPGLDLPQAAQFGESQLQLKFGPSAWFANERDPEWTVKVDPTVADYSRLFVTWAATRQIRQSAVTLKEVLDGLAVDDRRLHDEIVLLIQGAQPSGHQSLPGVIDPAEAVGGDRDAFGDRLEVEGVRIVEIGGEGGSICLFGALVGDQWHFWRGTDESTLLDMGADESDGPFVSRSRSVVGWDEGVRLLDRYPWVDLYPEYVHPDFADRVLEAVMTRSSDGRVSSRWMGVCRPDAETR